MAVKLILGSASKTRQKILKEKGYQLKVLTADIDEKKIRAKDPRDIVLKLAFAKAEAIRKKAKNGILITCDQITLSNGRILEKARNLNEAEEFLKSYSNTRLTHNLIISLVI